MEGVSGDGRKAQFVARRLASEPMAELVQSDHCFQPSHFGLSPNRRLSASSACNIRFKPLSRN